MNYKQAIDIFRSRYSREALRRKEPVVKMNDQEILLELSVIQKELSETYRLTKRTQTLDLVANQFQYTVGEESTNINADILDIDNIIASPLMSIESVTVTPAEAGYGYSYGLDYGGSAEAEEVVTVSESGSILSECHFARFLRKASLGDMGNWNRLSGLPEQYSYYDAEGDSILWIDSLPSDFTSDTTMRLFIIYNRKMYLFGDTEDNNNSTWSDYDTSLDGYGGSFKLPNQYHSLIIEGALASIFTEKENAFRAKAMSMVKAKPQSVSGKLKYKLGV